MIRIYNTKERAKADFEAIQRGHVGMYVCGPTVYNYIHVGNARTFISFDNIRRYLMWRGFDVKFVQNVTDVDDKIIAKSLEEGRKAIAWYVGRDTAELSEEGVIKAAVETVAENLTDGVVSPLMFMLIGGAPLGMLYKAVNTLDSMVGYHNDKYEYFGKFSAKMDDFFNFIPARLSALCMIAGAGMLHLDNRNALRIYRRDRSKHKSPNAGQTESVCAGALHIQLGGDASYFGKIVKKAAFGDPMRRVDRTDILAAVDLMTAASVFALVLCCVMRLIVKS